MTGKEKIRAEIERRIEELQPCNTRENLRAHGAIAGYYQILSFIDSMQEEPKFKTGDRIKPIDSCLGSPRTIVDVCDSWYVTDQGTLDFEFEDNWELAEEHKKCMYSKDNYTNEDRKLLCDGCEEECKYNKKEPSIPDIVDEHFDEMLGEEPVSKVWHDSNLEQPNPKKITLGIFKDKTCPVVGYNSWYEENSIWAYLDDILNLTHSLTKINNQEPVSDDLNKFIEDIKQAMKDG